MKLFSWLLELFLKVVKKKHATLPSATSQDNRIDVVSTNDQFTKLQKILVETGQEVIRNEELELYKKRQEFLKSKELTEYFKNIWKKIDANKNTTKFIIYPEKIGCKINDYDLVVSLFKEALEDSKLTLEIWKDHEYWFFSDSISETKTLLEKITSINTDEVKNQLSQGAPYR
jgi:hypothetical protein